MLTWGDREEARGFHASGVDQDTLCTAETKFVLLASSGLPRRHDVFPELPAAAPAGCEAPLPRFRGLVPLALAETEDHEIKDVTERM